MSHHFQSTLHKSRHCDLRGFEKDVCFVFAALNPQVYELHVDQGGGGGTIQLLEEGLELVNWVSIDLKVRGGPFNTRGVGMVFLPNHIFFPFNKKT